jgi:peptidyl-prolyl cis-trans isomerase A (cyclophilin A)
MKRPVALLLLLVVCLAVTAATAKDPKPGLYATFDTTMGKIVIKLFEKEAPKTVANFVDLATGKKAWRDSAGKMHEGEPFYTGIIFHRVIPDFMAQAGAHLADGGHRQSQTIADLKHDRAGRLSMANAGPNTGSSQFFITHQATPWLDGKHAIFGQVVEGQKVVNSMARVRRDARDVPHTPIVIEKVTIERVEKTAAKAKE